MLDEGVNVFRINFSHADYKDVKKKINLIREINEESGYHTAILGDLQGPKLRIGTMEKEENIAKSQQKQLLINIWMRQLICIH